MNLLEEFRQEAKTSRAELRNYEAWEQAYDYFSAAVLALFEHRGAELRRYKQEIRDVATNYAWKVASDYDKIKRAYISMCPHLSLDSKTPELLERHVKDKQLRAISDIVYVEGSKDSRGGPTYFREQLDRKGKETCRNFNRRGCSRQHCIFRHACSTCGGAHPASSHAKNVREGSHPEKESARGNGRRQKGASEESQ
ncbi:hypothetical protein BC829DRAFT_169503 [Chytridium lagenaria]|nr:hypothetical protein BC829DRAFT_169503 [Chytridium lagenaria]